MSKYITHYIIFDLRVLKCLINMFKVFEQNIIELLKNADVCLMDNLKIGDLIFKAFIKTYNELPKIVIPFNIDENDCNDNEITLPEDVCEVIPFFNKDCLNIGIDVEGTVLKICEKYPESKIIKIGENKPIIFNNDFIVYPSDLSIYFHKNNSIPELFKYFIPRKRPNKNARVYYVSKGMYGFETYPFNLIVKDIEGNYNDDLPLEKINKILESNESSIMLFNGTPGCGKSSLIRYLINKHKENKEFLYLDSSIFHAMTDSTFIQFLLRHKNAVIILEDCEQILKSREDNSRNELIATILNISDGLLGDSLNLKFICTFNTDLNNIDKAITRKGRLKLKYEFRALCKEKVAKIFEKQGINPELATSMTLAEVYNFEDDNGVNKERKKVGF